MASEYTHKMVDGVLVELTPAEVAECEARAAQAIRQHNTMAPDPGYGDTIKDTLIPPPLPKGMF